MNDYVWQRNKGDTDTATEKLLYKSHMMKTTPNGLHPKGRQ